MPDVFTQAKRSDVMSRIRSRGNKATELALVKLFRAQGITGWRRQLKLRAGELRVKRPSARSSQRSTQTCSQLIVRPDFVFREVRLALFVDGCFWHGCPKHGTKPRSNAAFWRKKFAANQARDRLVTRALRRSGWRVLRVWEHELARKNQARLRRRIQRVLGWPREA
jgi:DNA mismatch endonuclease, patch repair protein